MAIRVIFDRNGWYHPAFGRLGRGDKRAGTIYVLPDAFGEQETIEVPVMDRTSKPPRETSKKTITRYKHLPSTVQVLDDDAFAQLEEEAEMNNEPAPRPIRPKVADDAELEVVTGKGKMPKAQTAQERTTGKRSARRKAS